MVNKRFDKQNAQTASGEAPDSTPQPVSVAALKAVFEGCYDFATRDIFLGGDGGRRVTLVYIDGLVSGKDIAELVVRPATCEQRFQKAPDMKAAIDLMMGGSVYAVSANRRETMEDTVSDLLNGFSAVVFDSEGTAVTFETRSDEKRQVGSPEEEQAVKGAKDAFVETLKVNTTLVRRKLRNPHLRLKEFKLGDKTDTMVVLAYIDGFTNTEIVAEAEKRLGAIKTEGALTAAVLQENLVDNPKTPFPQLMNTERTDKFCMNLLEGRVGVLVDGLPMGFLAPGTFSQFMKVPEDHAGHFLVASGLTLLRYLSLFITLLLPAFYVAVAMYHREMIPVRMMQSMIDAKQSVPFPTAIEVIMLLIAFELLQEAGLRLPNPVGQTVSIIGALIVGQSAVEAKIVSPVVVVVIALAGIAGYTMPNQDMGAALRVCRFLLVIMAICMGMFGMTVGFALLLHHLAGLESFGVPYMTPFAGGEGKYTGRALLRASMRVKKDAEPALRTGKGGTV